jgi:hypothetical protein
MLDPNFILPFCCKASNEGLPKIALLPVLPAEPFFPFHGTDIYQVRHHPVNNRGKILCKKHGKSTSPGKKNN